MFRKLIETKAALLLKIIGWVQIAGGVFGLGLMAKLMLQTGTVNGVLLLFFLVGVSLFIFSVYAGNMLLLTEKKRAGIVLSIINQSLQILQFNFLGYGFTYSAGIAIAAGIKGTSLSFRFEAVLATFQMSINSDDPYFIMINVVPILIIILLVNILKHRAQVSEGKNENNTDMDEHAV